MADIKTHLRELSVIVAIGIMKDNNMQFPESIVKDLYNSKIFFEYVKKYIDNADMAKNILDVKYYNDELEKIINNGIKLGKKIINNKNFKISKNTKFLWVGNETQKKDPIDIKVDNYSFSLKEDSFILKNMGLYQLLNTLTGSNYARGLHIFNEFALSEYDIWFKYTWENFISFLMNKNIWELKSEENESIAKIKDDKVVLIYNDYESIVPINIKTNNEYMEYTNSKTREKVFSKWINNIFSNDEKYVRMKKMCSEISANAICEKVNREYNSKNVYDFFQIIETEYYYGKSTSSETTLLKVPKIDDFDKNISFMGCRYEVPNSQVNIITSFENCTTRKSIEFRNECRFSHGQFNGTPEAKMYITRNSSLSDIYDII